jgi:hypothetical protein
VSNFVELARPGACDFAEESKPFFYESFVLFVFLTVRCARVPQAGNEKNAVVRQACSTS